MLKEVGVDRAIDLLELPSIQKTHDGGIIRHYRSIWNLGPKNSPVQEIANDLNVGALPGPHSFFSHGSYIPVCDGWTPGLCNFKALCVCFTGTVAFTEVFVVFKFSLDALFTNFVSHSSYRKIYCNQNVRLQKKTMSNYWFVEVL